MLRFEDYKFLFSGGPSLVFGPRQYIYELRKGVWCMGIFNNGHSGTVIGAATMRNHEVTTPGPRPSPPPPQAPPRHPLPSTHPHPTSPTHPFPSGHLRQSQPPRRLHPCGLSSHVRRRAAQQPQGWVRPGRLRQGHGSHTAAPATVPLQTAAVAAVAPRTASAAAAAGAAASAANPARPAGPSPRLARAAAAAECECTCQAARRSSARLLHPSLAPDLLEP